MPNAPEPPRPTRPKRWLEDRESDSSARALFHGVTGLVLGGLLMAAGDHFGGVEFEHGSKRSSGFWFFVLLAGPSRQRLANGHSTSPQAAHRPRPAPGPGSTRLTASRHEDEYENEIDSRSWTH